MSSASQINVMLVDDSAVIRGALKHVIQTSEHIKVIESVSNGQLAVQRAEAVKPHVVILDIEMPIMDGLTALPKILEVSPGTKVIMFSTLTEKGASVTLDAMRLGAVECLVKPSSNQDTGKGSEFQKSLTALIENLVPEAKRFKTDSQPSGITPPKKPSLISGPVVLNKDPLTYTGKPAIVAIGSSTGGPQALFNVLKHCTGFDVPIVITQHMPATFTRILAEHITQHTGIPTSEGQDGMRVEPGKAYVAPGGFHMLFEKNGIDITIKLDDGPKVNFCKPAVDPMYDSILKIHGRRVLGVILTGMGSDGLGGGKNLTAEKCRLIAQDEESSVVWGMPGAVAQAGLCSDILPLDQIGPFIKKAVMG